MLTGSESAAVSAMHMLVGAVIEIRANGLERLPRGGSRTLRARALQVAQKTNSAPAGFFVPRSFRMARNLQREKSHNGGNTDAHLSQFIAGSRLFCGPCPSPHRSCWPAGPQAWRLRIEVPILCARPRSWWKAWSIVSKLLIKLFCDALAVVDEASCRVRLDAPAELLAKVDAPDGDLGNAKQAVEFFIVRRDHPADDQEYRSRQQMVLESDRDRKLRVK